MTTIEVEDLRDGYLTVVNKVLNDGYERAPRGIRTLELSPVMIVVHDSSKVVPVGVGRKLRMEIGAAESVHLLGGFSDAAQMVSITKNFEQFVEGGRFLGAYGPRTAAQFPRVVDLIGRDRDTRQAGVVIWRPWDLARPSKDVPCTIELHFALVSGRLDMLVSMRSNDVFWGLPYDAWMFANAQHAVAYALGVPVGTYRHLANSLHAYVDRDKAALDALHRYDGAWSPPMFMPAESPLKDGAAAYRWDRLARMARNAAGLGKFRENLQESLPKSAAWYRDALLPHHTDGLLCPACLYVLPKTDEHFYFGDGKTYTNRLVCRRCRTLRKRGLAPDDYERLLFEQGFACAVCKEEKELVIDHDHAGDGTARGLLCRTCNELMSVIDSRFDFFGAAQAYLAAAKKRMEAAGG